MPQPGDEDARMVDLAVLARLALALPQVVDASSGGRVAFEVGGKGLAWSYLVRARPKGRREAAEGVIAVRCPLPSKEMRIEAAPDRFFDDDHYRGYPAVLVRLARIDEAELAALLEQAWRIQAPKALVRTRDAEPRRRGGLS